ncbi:MAG TPA: epoxide hydrolase [Devosia sp.]|jgi:pimeloyl-ACP methyl ester carboxylesterase|uniref:epoxide hydrolase family protein n=1 Tax=Devosia sp. TaxID=1871048 RepID=UPI002DDCBA17|nr:epoxide hydrolase [Devosia sp.]HEV2518168.1 epoxide hydrolase [Devosia sp.]
MATITPFKIDVSAAALQELKDRLARTVMPSEVEGSWAAGPTNAYVGGAVDRLLNGFDWRKAEAEINLLPQFTTEIDGQNVHFIQVKSAEQNATPLLLIHGWPGSIVEFLDVIGPLTDPVAHGGKAEDAFDVVVPSLPGFGFSGPTREAGWNNVRIGKAFIELMSRLGYQRFGVQGGDAGAIIGPEIGRLAPERVIGIHLNAATMGFIPFGPVSPEEIATFTDSEKVRLQRVQRFMAEHFGFNIMQSSRPQTLAYGISDSPAGLLAWISELFTSFGDGVDAVPMDRFLTNFMIYWFTGTAASSIRLYYENAHDPEAWSPKANSGVPTGVAVFGFDEVPIRRYGETSNTIVRWNEFDVGGHYAVLEVPEVWVGDVRGFFAQIG